MIIWIFNHYADKPGGLYQRHFDFGSELVKKGHQVHIFSSAFSHNRFKYEVKFQSICSTLRSETYDGVVFHFLRTTPYCKNNWRRVLNIVSYFILVLFHGIRKRPRPDVIIGSSVHPLAPLAAYIISKLRKSKFVFEVRDLWPETLFDIGLLKKDSLIGRFLRYFEKFLYRKAKKILVLLPYADEYIASLGIPKEKIAWIPNGTKICRFAKLTPPPLKSSPPFSIYYLGAFGNANGLDVAIKGFALLEKKFPGFFEFHLFGSGPEKENLTMLVSELNVKSVYFHSPVSKEKIYTVMSAADCFLFILKDLPLFKFGISPNKLNDYLSSYRPVISLTNVPNNVVKDSGCGVYRTEITPVSLAEAVEELFLMKTPEERFNMGLKGRKYIEDNYEIKKLSMSLNNLLFEVANNYV
jgi:glycosyltransferase involved in cell wall biosynthesis